MQSAGGDAEQREHISEAINAPAQQSGAEDLTARFFTNLAKHADAMNRAPRG